MAKWFYLVGGQQIGPVESRQLKLLAASGRLAPNDPVRREDMAEWFQAKDINGLFIAAQPTLPPASAKPIDSPGQDAVCNKGERSTKRSRAFGTKWLPFILAAMVLLGIRGAMYLWEQNINRSVSTLLVDSPQSPPPAELKTTELQVKSQLPPRVADKPSELRTTRDASASVIRPPVETASPTGNVPWVARSLGALPTTTSPNPHGARARYKNSAFGFSIIFPQGWTVKEPLANGEIVIKANRRGDNHKFATLLIKTARLDLPAGTPAPTPEEFSATYFTDGRPVLDSAADAVDGRTSYWLETKTTVAGIPAYMVSCFLVEGGVVYCLEGVIVTPNPEWIDENAPSILQSIQSFRFTK
jgi:hypothetical protein